MGTAYKEGQRIYRIIWRGQGALGTDNMGRRIRRGLGVFLTQRTVLKRRPLASIFHTMVAWGFTFYLLVNVIDVAIAWFAELKGLFYNPIGSVYLLLADRLTMGVLVGMVALLIRRFTRGRKIFAFNKNVVLHPKASFGIKRDSTIVGLFILFHVGSRYVGSTIAVTLAGGDPWQPFATLGGNLWAGMPVETLEILEHVFFWGAIGSIMLFIPYFLISKHIHLLMGPMNQRRTVLITDDRIPGKRRNVVHKPYPRTIHLRTQPMGNDVPFQRRQDRIKREERRTWNQRLDKRRQIET